MELRGTIQGHDFIVRENEEINEEELMIKCELDLGNYREEMFHPIELRERFIYFEEGLMEAYILLNRLADGLDVQFDHVPDELLEQFEIPEGEYVVA